MSVQTEGLDEQGVGGQFGFSCVSRKTYYMSDRTHILTLVYFETCLHEFLFNVFVLEIL
jgi:hypothetical protein